MYLLQSYTNEKETRKELVHDDDDDDDDDDFPPADVVYLVISTNGELVHIYNHLGSLIPG